MTAPAPLDLPALLDDLERAHEEWRTDDGLDVATTDGRVWNTLFRRPRWMDADDVHRLVALHNAVPTLIAELRKRDAALRAVEVLAEQWANSPLHDLPVYSPETFADHLRAALAAALSPESVQS